MSTGAILLAGGSSERFGGFPKALLSTGERSAVRRLAELALNAGLEPVVTVVGAHRAPVEHELRGLPVELVVAEDWFEGRTASVQAGVRALPPGCDVLLWPVDHPFVSARTLDTLLQIPSHDALAVWFIPTYRGAGGHPVVWRAAVRSDVLDLRPDAPLRSLLPEFGPQVRRFAVEDPGVVANADSPDRYTRAYDEWRARGED